MRISSDLPPSVTAAPPIAIQAHPLQAEIKAAERPLIWKTLQVVARLLTTWLFDLKIYGLEYIPEYGGALIVSNHQSYLDPIVLGTRLRRPLSYVAKEELFHITPSFTWLLRALGAFPVRMGYADVRAVKESIDRLHSGFLLNIYPEGARTPDGKIGKLERGVALIERRARVPIIPAVIVGAFEAWPLFRTLPRPWPVRVQFGPPMEIADLPPAEMVAEIDRTLRRMFDELRTRPIEPSAAALVMPPRYVADDGGDDEANR
jgi:1-acyl-sn-glycerol-3-phosphate acyltransferase